MKKVNYFLLLLFLIANSAFRLGTGFDAIIVRLSFFGLLFSIFIFNKKFKISSILKWGLIFWSYFFISILWAKNSSDTLNRLDLAIQILGCYIFIPNLIEKKSDIKTVLKYLIFSSTTAMILLALRTPIYEYGTERLGEAIGQNPNGFGMIMSVSAIFCLYFYQFEKNKKNGKILFLVLLIAFSLFSLLSGSKKALLLLICGIVFLELFATKKTKRLRGLLITVAIVPTILYLVFNNQTLYSVLGYRLEKTFMTITNQSTNIMIDQSLIERKYFREQAIYLFKQHPIVGVGGNNFTSYMRSINYKHVAYSHNNYTELLATLGLIGFMIYYLFYAYIVITLLKMLKKGEGNREINILFIIILTIFLILDYGLVSFYEIFNAIVLTIINQYIVIEKKGEVDENN